MLHQSTSRSASNAEVVHDAEAEEAEIGDESAPEYVEVVDPAAPEISFLKSDCPERRVVRVVCDQLGEFIKLPIYLYLLTLC